MAAKKIEPKSFHHIGVVSIDEFGVSDATDEISVRGCKLDFGPVNSMKIRENPENALPGLWILLHPNAVC